MRPAPASALLSALVVVLAGCAARRAPAPAAGAATAPRPADVLPGATLAKCGVVVPLGPPGAWDDGMVESPTVWYDARARRYGMLYVGYGRKPGLTGPAGYRDVTAPRLGLAWSDDLVRWRKEPAPVYGPGPAGSPDAAGATGPFVWAEDGVYHLFAIGVTEAGYEGGRKTIVHATSPDLRTWTRDPAPAIVPAGDGWRRDAAWRPYVVKDGARYVLFFNASGVVDGHEEETIGYATSPDLRTWTVVDDGAPILAGSRTPGAWDASGRAGDPSVFRDGDRWVMAYYSWDGKRAQDGLAWTTAADFPGGWRPYAGNPVLRLGAPGTFDAQHAHKPTVVRPAGGGHYHFYTAVADDHTRTIALAVEGAACR